MIVCTINKAPKNGGYRDGCISALFGPESQGSAFGSGFGAFFHRGYGDTYVQGVAGAAVDHATHRGYIAVVAAPR